jgi:hypothetical protein
MPDSLHRQLLSQAYRLARLDPKKPKQGNLRRAISTAYYAFFHFFVDHACRCVIGTANDRRPYRDILARAFQHTTMVQACKTFAGGTFPASIQPRLPQGFVVPNDLQIVAPTFVLAQERRHAADYDPGDRFPRADVLTLIRNVDDAMTMFESIRGQIETHFFLVCLLAWGSLSRR